MLRTESKICSQFSTINDSDIPKLDSTAGLILHLNENAPLETREFVLTKLKSNHLNLQRIVQTQSDSSNNLFLVTCYETLILKHFKNVYPKQQLKRQLDNLDEDTIQNEDLTDSERQRIIQNILEAIEFEERSTLIGMESVKCYPGQSLVEICYKENVIFSYFPLHDYSKLQDLSLNFFSPFSNDINSVRNYFGEKIAFYFSFLNLYTLLFLITSTIVILGYVFSSWIIPEVITLLNCTVLFIFWKFWNRQSDRLAFKWGTLEAFELEKARLAFRSKEIRKDSITGLLVPYYPIKKTWLKEYCLSLPIVFLCVYVAFEIMCIYFNIEDFMISIYNKNPSVLMNFLTYLPSIMYTILIIFMNKWYRKLAEWLNDYENHRTQASHENHLIIKLILFEFINNFMSLFYIAFYLKNIEMLKWNLFTMLTINQSIDNIIEVILPFIQIYLKTCNKKLNVTDLLNLTEASDIYYDFLELFIQFGFVFLFLPVFPYGPLIGLINSYLEIRLDGMKFCFCLRRPLQRTAKGINNGWLKAFEFLTIIITLSNLTLIGFTSKTCSEIAKLLEISTFTLMIIIEHLFFLLILVVWNVIPNTPKNVSMGLSKQRYLNLKILEDFKKND